MEKIGYQHGIEATRVRWNTLDPNRTAYDKFSRTVEILKNNSNELVDNQVLDRLARLELAVAGGTATDGPFPGSS